MKYRWNENADNRECTGEKEQWAISKSDEIYACRHFAAPNLASFKSRVKRREILNRDKFEFTQDGDPRIGRIPPRLLLWKAATRRCDKRVGTRVRELWGEISLKFSEQSYARRSRDGALPLECPTTSHALITFTFKLAVFARVPGTYYLFTTAHFSVIRLRPRVLEESHVWWGKNTNGTKNYEGRFFFCRICIIISTNSFLFFLDCNEL